MNDNPMVTQELAQLVARLQAGDESAKNEILRRADGQLRRLAHKMLQKFPSVQRWEDSDDILQNASLRFMRALETVAPQNTRHFLNLAATQIRRELLDLVRRYQGSHGLGANHESLARDDSRPGLDPADSKGNVADLEFWQSVHEAIEELPIELRETVGLRFYHGWTFVEIAELFQVDERTARRRWHTACIALSEKVGGNFSGF